MVIHRGLGNINLGTFIEFGSTDLVGLSWKERVEGKFTNPQALSPAKRAEAIHIMKSQNECREDFLAACKRLIEQLEMIDAAKPASPVEEPRWWVDMVELKGHAYRIVGNDTH